MKSPDTLPNYTHPKRPYKMLRMAKLARANFGDKWLVLYKFRKKQYQIFEVHRAFYDAPTPDGLDYDPSHLKPVYTNKKLERAETRFAKILLMDRLK